MFHLKDDDFVAQMERVLAVGDFYEFVAGGPIIIRHNFTSNRKCPTERVAAESADGV